MFDSDHGGDSTMFFFGDWQKMLIEQGDTPGLLLYLDSLNTVEISQQRKCPALSANLHRNVLCKANDKSENY